MPPLPKHPSQRQRRNRATSIATIEASPAQRPELPSSYHKNTHSWWTVIWSSPISDEWVDADVPGLVALAQLVDDFWTADAIDRSKRHAEVRMASQQFGLSPMSRRQLQWEIKRVEAATPAKQPRTPTRRSSRTVLSVLGGTG